MLWKVYRNALSAWAAYEIKDKTQAFGDKKRALLRSRAEMEGRKMGKSREVVHDEFLAEITFQCRANPRNK